MERFWETKKLEEMSREEWEVQEYPEIGYSFQERNTLRDVISSEIGNLIADMLPGENENEQ